MDNQKALAPEQSREMSRTKSRKYQQKARRLRHRWQDTHLAWYWDESSPDHRDETSGGSDCRVLHRVTRVDGGGVLDHLAVGEGDRAEARAAAAPARERASNHLDLLEDLDLTFERDN